MNGGRSSRTSTVVVLVVAAAALIAACSVFQDGDDELANPGRAVLAYIKSQWPADIQAAHARREGS